MARLSHRLVGSCLAASALVVALLGPRAAAQAPAFTLEGVLSYPFPDSLIAAPAGNVVAWTFNERGAAEHLRRRRRPTSRRGASPPTCATTGRSSRACRSRATARRSSTCAAARTAPTGPPKATCRRIPAASAAQPQRPGLVGALPAAARRCCSATATRRPIAPSTHLVAFETRAPYLDCADRRLEAGRAGVLRARHEPGAGVVARRHDAGVRLESRRPQLHRPLHGRAADPLSRAVDLARLVARVVARRRARSRSCGSRGAAARRASPLLQQPSPWAIWVAPVDPRQPGRRREAREAWKAARRSWTRRCEPPARCRCSGRPTIALVFMSYQDGWPHLYSLQHPGEGTTATLLTPGAFMVEHASLTPDGRTLVYSATPAPTATISIGASVQGSGRRRDADGADVGRRHGVEPVVTCDGRTSSFLASTAQRSPLPAVVPLAGGALRVLAADRVPRTCRRRSW